MKVQIILILATAIVISASGYYAYREGINKNSSEAKIYFDSAEYFRKKDEINNAYTYYEKVPDFGNDSLTVKALITQGAIKAKQGDYPKAESFYHKGLEYANKIQSAKWQARAYSGLSWLCTERGSYDSALQFAHQSINLDSSLKSQADVNRNIGILYRRQGDFQQAIEYQLRSLRAAIQIDFKEDIAAALNNLGNTYSEMGEDEEACKYYDSCIAVAEPAGLDGPKAAAIGNVAMIRITRKEFDLAEKNINEMLAISNKNGYSQYKPFIYESMGRLNLARKNYGEAIKYYNMAKSLYEERSQLHFISSQLAEVYMSMKDFDTAERYIQEYINTNSPERKFNTLYEAEIQMFRLDSMRGNYKQAVLHIREAWGLRDSIYNLEKRTAIEKVSQKYNSEQQQKIIAMQQVSLEKEKNSSLITIISALLFTTIVLLFYFIYRQRQKKALTRLHEESKRKRLSAVFETQERVQQSIARDLHDGLVQVLSAVKLSLEASLPDVTDHIHQSLQHSSIMIDEACREVRSISHQLLPYSLNKDGLPAALKELVGRSGQKLTMNCEFKVSGKMEHLPPALDINIYRIAQELVNNIHRHARASSIFMHLTFLKDSVVLWVEDNGQGFNYNKDSLGVGLQNIMTRLEMINGRMNIETSPGRGTSISISIPVYNNGKHN